MISKFLQGGTSQQGSILLQILQLPEDLLKLLMQAFAQWAQQKGVNILQLLNDPLALEMALGLFILEILQQPLNQPQAARHGAKLNYIKLLKHQCADDEEVYYYKKGGSLGCGCKKKESVEKAQNGGKTVEKFKKDREKQITENDTIHTKQHGIRGLRSGTGYPNLSRKEYEKLPQNEKNRVDKKDFEREYESPVLKFKNRKK